MSRIPRNLPAYHESIGAEFVLVKQRVESLIGSRHWPTDGAHKETVLRNVLRRHLPENLRVGTGFVCFPKTDEYGAGAEKDTSFQIDVLITRVGRPTLYR